MAQTVGIWIAALLTLAIFSFLYKDNPFYKLAEHIFLGVSAGYWVCVMFHNVILPNAVMPIITGFNGPEKIGVLGYVWYYGKYIIPLLLGLLALTHLVPRFSWLSKWPMAVVVGTTSAITVYSYTQSWIIAQVKDTMQALLVIKNGVVDWGLSCNNIIFIIGVLSTLVYFYFSKEHKGKWGDFAKTGIYFLMIAFGAGFGYGVMARVSLLIGRITFLLGDWLHIIKGF